MGLNEIKAALKKYDVRPSKRLGQNFLIDANVRDKILNAVDVTKSDTILEIGPGLGALTEGLSGASGRVIAIEKDKRLCEFLRKSCIRPNLEIVNADILDYLDTIDIPDKKNLPFGQRLLSGRFFQRGPPSTLLRMVRRMLSLSNHAPMTVASFPVTPKAGGESSPMPLSLIAFNKHMISYAIKKIKVVGNLPYYITSPIITGLLKKRRSFSHIFVTVQNEFADRLVAPPGSKEYGSISCFVRFCADASILFRIKRTCFYPAPKVDSSFVRLVVREDGLCLTDEEKLFKIIRTSFGKRRKTMLNSLKACDLFLSSKDLREALGRAGILHDRRPETVSLEEFIRLTKEADRGRRE